MQQGRQWGAAVPVLQSEGPGAIKDVTDSGLSAPMQHIEYHLVSPFGQAVRLEPPRTYVCGRGDDADVVVPDSLISRHHAELRWDEEALLWHLVDLGSRNGTLVNGETIAEARPLLDRACIQFGGQAYTFIMAPAGVDQDELVREARRLGSDDTVELGGTEEEIAAGFRGSVARGGLLDLLQFFTLTRRSGRLDLEGEEPGGSIWFEQGSIRHATAGDERGEPALTALAGRRLDRFVFVEDEPPPGETSITASAEQLLMNLALAQDGGPPEVDGDAAAGAAPQPDGSEPAAATAQATDAAPDAGDDGAAGPPPAAAPTPATGVDVDDATPTAGVIAADPDANGVFAGRRFGNVALRCILGHGAMAQVYRGRHEMLGSDVAIKVMLQRGGLQDEQNRKRFLREARLAATVKHPNVVQVMDAGVSEDGHPYLVMELIEGPTLGHLLAEKGRLAFGELGRYAAGIADGLGAIHAQGVVHRDVKPDNVLIAGDGTPKLSDLGMARRDDDETIQRLTGTGVVLGTPAYMAPESVDNSHASGPPADVYSFGVMCYHLLSGRPPFMGDTPYQVMRAHLRGDYVPLSELVDDLDQGVARLIHQCMERNPEQRPDARTLAEGLRAFQHNDHTSDEVLSHVRVSGDLKKMAREHRQAKAGSGARPAIKIGVMVVVAILLLVLIAVASLRG